MKIPDWLEVLTQKLRVDDPIAYLARNSRSFRFATRFLPAPRAREIAEVYAFCRFSDDLVDAAGNTPVPIISERLEEWEYLARLAHAGSPTGLSLLDGPIGTMGRKGISFEYVSSLLDGMRMDLSPRHYGDLHDLEQYTYRVAGVVGQWLTELAGIHNHWALARAADLGQAMQLTNIVRDVGEDWDRGRLYLPLSLLEKNGLSPQDIGELRTRKGEVPAAYWKLMEEMMGLAESRYQLAMQGIPALPEYFQRPVLVALLVYREIHEALRSNRYDNFNLRAHSSAPDKFGIGIRAFWLLPRLRMRFSSPRDHLAVSPSLLKAGKDIVYGH